MAPGMQGRHFQPFSVESFTLVLVYKQASNNGYNDGKSKQF